MKRLLILLAAALAMGSALAQSPPQLHRPDPAKMLERITILLDLDEYQKGEVQKVLEAQHAKMEAERAQFESSGTRPSFEAMEAKHAAMQKETTAALSGVLTAEQLKKWEVLMNERPRVRVLRGPPPDKE
jgi:hypothetical protein